MKSFLIRSIVFATFVVFVSAIDNYKSLTHAQQNELQAVINKWSSKGAFANAGLGTEYSYGHARIELQAVETLGSHQFHRYSAELGSKGVYAVVHLQTGIDFGVSLIRGAFEQSRNNRVHVFITREGVTFSTPSDGNTYVLGLINQKLNGQATKTAIGSSKTVVDALSYKFDNTAV